MEEKINITKCGNKVPYVWITCEICGKEHWHNKYQLKTIKSCGCLKNKNRHPHLIDRKGFGLSYSPIGKKWTYMMSRCYNKASAPYHKYGGRGITVCDRWKDFYNFYDDMCDSYNKHSIEHGDKKTSLDRINSELGYFSDNCRWVTIIGQNNNLSTNRKFIFKGDEFTIPQIANILGQNKHTLRTRMRRHNFDLEFVLSTYY